MSVRVLIGLGIAASLGGTLAASACRGPKPGPLPRPSASTPASVALPIASGSTAAPKPSAAASAPTPADTVAIAVSAARACQAPTSVVNNHPDGGLVFVNAWRRKDSGNIDRLQGVVEAIGAASSAFRCCFDVWVGAHPSQEGKVMLTMELDPEGAVKSTAIDDARSSEVDDVTRRCVIDVARGLTYPPSPSNRSTLVEFPFRFSAGS